MIEQALQIGRHQNIHAGRSGLEEFPLGSISTGGQEIGQDVVLIGSANQSAHRQAHLLCIVARQNITKIARRHTEVHLVTKAHLPCLEQLGVGGKVVNDLRHQTAPVDGVCTGQADVPLCQLGSNGRVAKDLLHAGLGIIEVAAHSVDRHIFAFLGHHLQALDLTGAARGEEHRDLHTRDIMVAIQRSLAGIAAGRHQDQCFLGAVKIFLCLHQQLRHQLQGVILEGAGRAVPQFQRVHLIRNRGQITRLSVKGRAIGGLGGLLQELLRIIGQILPHDGSSHLGVIQRTDRLDIHLREALRNKQTALIRQALCNGLRGTHHAVMISRAEKLHCRRSFLPAGPALAPCLRQRQKPFSAFSHRCTPHYAVNAPFIICTIQRPLSRGITSATSKRTGSSLCPVCWR